MNFLFVMKHRGNAGNIHALADYMRVAERYGHRVALFGEPQPWLPDLAFSMDVHAFDKVVYLFESEIYRVGRLHEVALLGHFSREDRMVLDMDGMYNPVVVLDDYDRNHGSESSWIEWKAHLDSLSARIKKPVHAPVEPLAHGGPLTFYGYDDALEIAPEDAPEKVFDIVYVGHNWWRWRELEREVFPALERVRDRFGRIALIGLWWDGPPPEGADAGDERAFASEPGVLDRLHIEALPSVMYHEVVRTMSRSKINIFTQRPLLHHLRHLTLKYFEIFYADTIPLLMLDPDHAERVYGPAGRELALPGRVSETLTDALQRPDHYRGLVSEVRGHLARHHSYDQRIEELVSAFKD
ncbi:MAG: hypothetical protein AB7L90_19800 [Hyphomicrobiaceae bacterium]